MRVTVYEKPAEARPWRVSALKGAAAQTWRFATEQEARDLEARIWEYNGHDESSEDDSDDARHW
jgi:hypothetical protein